MTLKSDPNLLRDFAFHDTSVRGMTLDGAQLTIHLDAFVWEFEAPGEGPRTIFVQKADVILSGVSGGTIPTLEIDEGEWADVWTGSLTVDGEEMEGYFSLPMSISDAEILFSMDFNEGQILRVKCRSLRYEPLSDLVYLQSWPSNEKSLSDSHQTG